MLTLTPNHAPQPTGEEHTAVVITPEYSISPDFTSSSSPEAESHEFPQQSAPTGRKTRVVRTSNGTLRNCSICGDLKNFDIEEEIRLHKGRKLSVYKRCDEILFFDFRCACRACRFEKCVQAGMNPRAIHYPNSTSDPLENLQIVPATISHLHSEDFEYTQKLKLMIHREKIVQQMRSVQFPIYPTEDLDEILKQPCLFGKHVFEQNNTLVQQQVYETHPMIFWLVADLYLTIEYAKTFLCFQAMTEQDQKCLLAHVGGVVQVASQAYYSVLQESESVCFPDGVDALQRALQKYESKHYENYYREIYCKPVAMIRALKLSMEEFVLFKALALFSPDEIDLSKAAREDVSRKRLDILKYMRKLMVSRYGLQRGIEKLAECLFALPTFLQLSEKRRNHILLSDLTKRFQLPAVVRTIYLGQ